ncbi:hypothetical protein D3C85_888790 [compost metagenome]
MGTHADRAHARATAAVGYAEGFVQVHVRDIGTDVGWPRQADLGIEIGAIHVHLPAVGMDDLTHFADTLLIHTMGGRVGRHQA